MQSLTLTCKVVQLNLALDSDRPVSRFLAATIRGGLGYTLRRTVCATGARDCKGCILRRNCAYAYIFEPGPPAGDAPRLRKVESIPRAFVLRPRREPNATVVELVLIGECLKYLAYFIYAFKKLGTAGLGKERIRFTVHSVTTLDGQLIYPLENGEVSAAIVPDSVVLAPGKPGQEEIELNFLTPLVIRKDGRIVSGFDAQAFVRSALRRFTNLNAFYGGDKDARVDPRPWLDAARTLEVQDYTQRSTRTRFSTRQKKKIDYSGVTGKVVLKGDIGTLRPLLEAGRVLGVGKNTVFGQGWYRLCDIPVEKEYA